ncbi:MAG TPA: hypothetical protein VH682_09440 [Gemmataceae bacterium]|jgi:hypothetical protein
MSRYGLGLTVLVLGVLAVTVGGCGRTEFTFYPVEGTVTKGGRSLANIEVVFLADPDAGTVGPRVVGRTDAAGHYRLRTERGEDGAVAGKHLVLILDLEAHTGRRGRSPQPKDAARLPPELAKYWKEPAKTTADEPRVPPRYASINETPLRVEVWPGEQVINLEVK